MTTEQSASLEILRRAVAGTGAQYGLVNRGDLAMVIALVDSLTAERDEARARADRMEARAIGAGWEYKP